jgi:hypothetical protein
LYCIAVKFPPKHKKCGFLKLSKKNEGFPLFNISTC